MYSVVLICGLSPERSEANLPLRTTMPMGFAVFQNGGIVSSIVLRTFRCATSLPLRFACGPRPLTAAGGQGPQDNTAYGPCTSDQSPSRAEPCVTVAQPLSCSAYMQNRGQTERPWPSLGPSYPPKVMAIHIQSRPRRTFPASSPLRYA